MGEVLKFATPGGGLRKKHKKSLVFFTKITQFLDLFKLNFGFERPVLSSAKRAQNTHKKNWRKQTKLLDFFFLVIVCERPRKEIKIFLAIDDRLFAICRAVNTKLL